MFTGRALNVFALLTLVSTCAHAHIALWHNSMWGFNATQQSYPYDNRPVSPLMDMTFDQWWFHGHLDKPPHPGDFFELPAGKPATAELACNKGATSFFASSEGGDIRDSNNPNNPCPGSDISEFHTTGFNDLFGCGLGITYQSDVNQVKPEDFAMFSINQTCVWNRFTDFQVPARMPPCPPGGCICAWFWIHSPDSGGEQNYMNGFRCNVTGSTSNVAVAKPQLARQCGKNPADGKMEDFPGNCTYGAKQPFYWFQKERNNMFEGTYSPPRYLDLYNFRDGAQDDIFEDSYPGGIPIPGPNQTIVPTPFLGGATPMPAAATPPSDPTTASISLVSASSNVLSSSSALISSSSSLTVSHLSSATSLLQSVPKPTATVVQTAVITVTATPSASPPASSSSQRSTATVFNTVIVTVVNSEAAAPSITVSPSATVTVVNTVIVTQTASVPVEANVDTVRNGTRPAIFAQVDDIDANNTAINTTSAVPVVSANRMCKRQAFSDSASLQDRSKSFFFLPGSRSHRKLTKKSSLWNIF